MPNIFLWLSGALLGKFALTVMAKLGILFLSIALITAGMDWLVSMIKTEIGGLPNDVLSILGLVKADVALNLIFSAYLVRLAFSRARVRSPVS